MNRRRFLLQSLSIAGASLASRAAFAEDSPPAALPEDPPAASLAEQPMPGAPVNRPPDLVAVKGEPRAAAKRAIDALGGLKSILPANGVVLIKPNASFATPPEAGATTHPEVLAGVIEACLEAGARRVIVADHTMGDAERCLSRSGTRAAVAEFSQAKLISLDDEALYEAVAVPRGRALKSTAIASVVKKADLFINLPTAKAHNATHVAFGLKNHLGLIWNRNLLHNEMDIHVGIADLATVLTPQLTVLDAVYALKTNGPTGPGEVEQLGRVVAARDPVAVDAYGVCLTNWNGQQLGPEKVAHIRLAAEYGLGSLELSKLTIAELTC